MGISITEFFLVIACAIAAIAMVALKSRFASVMISLAVCMATAAVVTPAELTSCLFIGILLFAAFQIGGRFGHLETQDLRGFFN